MKPQPSPRPRRQVRVRADAAKPRTVGMVSLGCPKNLVDSEIMLGHLHQKGFEIVADARAADVIVVNTCAFIADARRESILTVLEMAREKETGRARRLVVTGCLAQRHDLELRREIPEIDATLGPGQVERIVEAVEGRSICVAPGAPQWLPNHHSPRLLSTPPYLAYVKIGDGCDYGCSFCVIPALRGKQRSRPPGDVVAEVRALAKRGVREVVLVAQDSTRYGIDLGMRHGLADLLPQLGRIEGIHWVRVMYAHPNTLSDRILDVIAAEEKVVKYIDVPLQHAAASVLRRMRRPAGRELAMGLVERMRRRVPGVTLRTSFIVGFPGETDQEFDSLVEFVKEAAFDHVGVFTYSAEEGTPAAALPQQPGPLVRENRRRRLMAVQKKIARQRNRARVGEKHEVLVEGHHPETELLLSGRLAGQAPEIDGSVVIGEGSAVPGSFVTCEILAGHAYDLVGRIVG